MTTDLNEIRHIADAMFESQPWTAKIIRDLCDRVERLEKPNPYTHPVDLLITLT